jgi:hypothetical protein
MNRWWRMSSQLSTGRKREAQQVAALDGRGSSLACCNESSEEIKRRKIADTLALTLETSTEHAHRERYNLTSREGYAAL